MNNTIHHRIIKYSILYFNTKHYSTTFTFYYNTVQIITKNTIHYSLLKYTTMQQNIVTCNTIPCHISE